MRTKIQGTSVNVAATKTVAGSDNESAAARKSLIQPSKVTDEQHPRSNELDDEETNDEADGAVDGFEEVTGDVEEATDDAEEDGGGQEGRRFCTEGCQLPVLS